MSGSANVATILDGPVGWLVVAGVAGVILYVTYSKVTAQIDLTEAQIGGNVQSFQCWLTHPGCWI